MAAAVKPVVGDEEFAKLIKLFKIGDTGDEMRIARVRSLLDDFCFTCKQTGELMGKEGEMWVWSKNREQAIHMIWKTISDPENIHQILAMSNYEDEKKALKDELLNQRPELKAVVESKGQPTQSKSRADAENIADVMAKAQRRKKRSGKPPRANKPPQAKSGAQAPTSQSSSETSAPTQKGAAREPMKFVKTEQDYESVGAKARQKTPEEIEAQNEAERLARLQRAEAGKKAREEWQKQREKEDAIKVAEEKILSDLQQKAKQTMEKLEANTPMKSGGSQQVAGKLVQEREERRKQHEEAQAREKREKKLAFQRVKGESLQKKHELDVERSAEKAIYFQEEQARLKEEQRAQREELAAGVETQTSSLFEHDPSDVVTPIPKVEEDSAESVPGHRSRPSVDLNAKPLVEAWEDPPTGESKLSPFCGECGYPYGESGDMFCGECGAAREVAE